LRNQLPFKPIMYAFKLGQGICCCSRLHCRSIQSSRHPA
jgi:hypothetical protein